MNYKLSKEKPPIYDKCVEKFGVNWEDGVIFTYGDTIHCKYDLPEVKIVHEATHIKQQAQTTPDEWWDRYFKDELFRVVQEVEAYRAETEWAYRNIKDRNKRIRLIMQNARDLSSPMYGSVMTLEEALKNLLK